MCLTVEKLLVVGSKDTMMITTIIIEIEARREARIMERPEALTMGARKARITAGREALITAGREARKEVLIMERREVLTMGERIRTIGIQTPPPGTATGTISSRTKKGMDMIAVHMTGE